MLHIAAAQSVQTVDEYAGTRMAKTAPRLFHPGWPPHPTAWEGLGNYFVAEKMDNKLFYTLEEIIETRPWMIANVHACRQCLAQREIFAPFAQTSIKILELLEPVKRCWAHAHIQQTEIHLKSKES